MGLFDFLNSKTVKINGVEFPKLNGVKIINKYTRNTPKYKRMDYIFKKIDDIQLQEYINEINSYGFYKKTDVRFENGNGDYVIIERDNSYRIFTKQEVIHIAFHVKKMNY